MKVDPILLELFSNLFVNLAAGWFGAAFIGPNFFTLKTPFQLFILTGDVLVGILCMFVAYKLKKMTKRKK